MLRATAAALPAVTPKIPREAARPCDWPLIVSWDWCHDSTITFPSSNSPFTSFASFLCFLGGLFCRASVRSRVLRFHLISLLYFYKSSPFRPTPCRLSTRRNGCLPAPTHRSSQHDCPFPRHTTRQYRDVDGGGHRVPSYRDSNGRGKRSRNLCAARYPLRRAPQVVDSLNIYCSS